MSKKPKKDAQHAAEPMRENASNSAPVSTGAVPSPQPPQEKRPSTVLFDLSRYSEEKIALVEEMGFPLRQISGTMNTWADSVERRIDILAGAIETNPEKTVELLRRVAEEARSRAMQNAPAQAGHGGGEIGGDLGTIMAMMDKFGGGASEDPFTKAIKEGMIKNAVESMNSDAAMGRAIKEHVVSSLASKVAKEIAEKVSLT